MRMTRIASIALALVSVCTTNAFAQQPTITPGLWQLELSLAGKSQDNPMAGYLELMKGQMASMSPEQRKQMQQALDQLGARGTEFTGDGVRTKECITKDDIARFDLFGDKAPESCTRQSTPVPGGVNFSMQCTQPQPMKIDATVKIQSEKAYSFESVTTLRGPDGKMMTQKSSGTGKWLASDCGKAEPSAANG